MVRPSLYKLGYWNRASAQSIIPSGTGSYFNGGGFEGYGLLIVRGAGDVDTRADADHEEPRTEPRFFRRMTVQGLSKPVGLRMMRADRALFPACAAGVSIRITT